VETLVMDRLEMRRRAPLGHRASLVMIRRWRRGAARSAASYGCVLPLRRRNRFCRGCLTLPSQRTPCGVDDVLGGESVLAEQPRSGTGPFGEGVRQPDSTQPSAAAGLGQDLCYRRPEPADDRVVLGGHHRPDPGGHIEDGGGI